MAKLTLQQRTKIIEFWHQTKSVKQVQREYARNFGTPLRHAPSFRTIKSTIEKFANEGTVCDLYKGRSGRRRTRRTEEVVEVVRQSVVQSPKKSIRRLSAETNIPKSSVQRILCQDIYAFPYKIQTETELTDEQKQRRLDFANWFSERLEEDEYFFTETVHDRQMSRSLIW